MAASPRANARNRHRRFLAAQRDEYDALVAAHGERCFICGGAPKTRRLHLDHDHRTMTVRGILCHRCNRALAQWATPEWCERAAEYLRTNLPVIAAPIPERDE